MGEKSERKGQKNKNPVIKRTVLELLPEREYVPEKECFRLEDGSYMDLLQIISKDLINASEDEVEYDCLKFAKAYRLYADDLKIVCLNFPCDYHKQKRFLEYKMKHTRNEIFKQTLEKKLQELVWLEKNNTTREYYYMIFAGNLEEIEKNRLTLTTSLGVGPGGLIDRITREKKEEILCRLRNKCNLLND